MRSDSYGHATRLRESANMTIAKDRSALQRESHRARSAGRPPHSHENLKEPLTRQEQQTTGTSEDGRYEGTRKVSIKSGDSMNARSRGLTCDPFHEMV
jgi:hypothetical protein